MKTKIKQLINRILGMKLVYRMILIYVIGGLLPLSAIIGYLIHGTNQVLVRRRMRRLRNYRRSEDRSWNWRIR